MTPKQKVLKHYPSAELVRDGWFEKAGPSGCYDFGIFWGEVFLGQGSSPQSAWKSASKYVMPKKARAALQSRKETAE